MRKRYWLTILILSVVFYGVYVGSFYLLRDFLDAQFDASAPNLLGLKNFGMVHGGNVREIFSNYGALMGAGMTMFVLVNPFFFWGILALLRLGKNVYARFINLLAIYGIMLGVGVVFVFYEERTTELSRSIIFYLGYPLLYASAVGTIAVIGMGIYSVLKKTPEKTKAGLIVLACGLTTLQGCTVLSDLTAMTCSFGIDETHCYQEAAIQSGDVETCEKVKQPEQFKKAGSNPPKDKCFMIVAENKQDPTICNKIQGGMFSYEKGDCVQEIAVETKNYDTCAMGATDFTGCMQAIADKDLKATVELIEIVKASSDTDEEKLKMIQGLTERTNKIYTNLSNAQKSLHDMNMSAARNLR